MVFRTEGQTTLASPAFEGADERRKAQMIGRGHGSRFAHRREAAIAALLLEESVEQAAAKVGLAVSTLRRWLADPDFAASYRAARQQAFEHTIGRLQQVAAAAVAALERHLAPPTPPNTQVRAAAAVLNLAVRAGETDLAARLAALEAAVAEVQGDDDAEAWDAATAAGPGASHRASPCR